MTLLLHPPVDGAALDASGAGEVGDGHTLVVRLADRGVQPRVSGGECAAAALGVALDAGEVVDAIHVSPLPDVSPSYTPAFVISHGAHRWDEKRAREVLPEALVQMLTVTETKLDRKLAQAKLPPDLYRQACVEGKPTIRAAK